MNPEDVAERLSAGQRSAIAGLDREFCVLGCSEDTAARLANGNSRRPALTVVRRGEQYREFALTDFGAAVKEVL